MRATQPQARSGMPILAALLATGKGEIIRAPTPTNADRLRQQAARR